MSRTRRRIRWSLLVVGVAALTAVVVPVAEAGAAGPCAQKRGAARAKCLRRTATTTTTAPAPARKDAGRAERGEAFPGTGSFAVGADIRPGLYRSAGDPADPAHGTGARPYYERLDATGEVIDNGRPWWDGVAWVEILPTDASFASERFLTWEPVDPTRDRGPRADSFDGWETCVLVGYDVAPGTYRASVEEGDPAFAFSFTRATYSDDDLIGMEAVSDGDAVTLPAVGRFFCSEGVDGWTRTG